MSTLKSSAEDLTLNADGSGNDVIIQSDGSTLVTIDGSQSSVGIGTATPTGNAKVHIYNGASGQAAASNNTELTIENSGTTGIQFLTPNTSASGIWFGDPENKEVGRMYYTHSEDSLKFFTAASERLRIDSDGIKFNADTAAANALSDYETGSWTPTDLYNAWTSSITATYCKYVKIGKQVTIVGYITLPTDGNSGAAASFGGLPFTPESNCYATGQVSHSASNPAHTNIYARVSGTGSTNVHILKQEDVAPTGDELETYVIFTVTYFV